MAAAVHSLFPGTTWELGRPSATVSITISNAPMAFVEEDLQKIEAKMKELVAQRI